MVSFFVKGQPATQGSKRAIFNPRANRAFVVDDCKRNAPWRSDVRNEAQKAFTGKPLEGPVSLTLIFVLDRPRGHFGSGKNAQTLKASSPKFPTGKPDITKLARAVEDALKGLVWRDDSQIVEAWYHKVYVSESKHPSTGVHVEVVEMNGGK